MQFPDTMIYRLAERADWDRARAQGVYRGSAIDFQDGYIHFSAAAQLAETARRHYRGRASLVLLAVETQALGDRLVWEPSRGGDLFPHLYDVLRTEDVVWVRGVVLDADGVPQTDALLAEAPL